MISEKVEAWRGRHLAPAPDFVLPDSSQYKPAIHTKQANWLSERLALIRSMANYAIQQSAFMAQLYDRGDGAWNPLVVPVKKFVSALGAQVQKEQIRRLNDEVLL
jgi:hypothetical protein